MLKLLVEIIKKLLRNY